MIVIFTHIPKTAGNTFASVLFKQYNYQTEIYSVYGNKPLPKNLDVDKIKCVIGHHPFGLHKHIPKHCQYITMLREPVDRVLSDYYFDLKFHDKKIEDWPIRPFIKTYSNRQTRWIAGNNQENLELAKAHLNRYFICIGITELFDESLYLMKRKLAWRDISYKKYNVNERRSPMKEASADVIDDIKANNQLDIQLYAYVKKKLLQEINHLDARSKSELETYKSRLCKGSVGTYANPDDFM